MGLDITIKAFDKIQKNKNNIYKMKHKEWSENGKYIGYHGGFYEFRNWIIEQVNNDKKEYEYFNNQYYVFDIDDIYQLEYDIHVKNIFPNYEVTYMDEFIDKCIYELSKGNFIVVYLNW